MSSLNAKALWKHCCSHALCSLKETSMHRPQANTTTKYPAGEWGVKRFVLYAVCLDAAQFLICSNTGDDGLKWHFADISDSWVPNQNKPRLCVDVTIATACRAVSAKFEDSPLSEPWEMSGKILFFIEESCTFASGKVACSFRNILYIYSNCRNSSRKFCLAIPDPGTKPWHS